MALLLYKVYPEKDTEQQKNSPDIRRWFIKS